MREILFRGKRLDNGEWSEGFYVALKLVHYDRIEHLINDKDTGKSYEIDPSTVGQYTGLKDNNGKRIFEGDILDGCDFDEEDGYGVVEWNEGAFEINNQFFTRTFHENCWGHELEVIGNIRDNPELLQEVHGA